MAWVRECDTIKFACDTCPSTLDVDANVSRLNTTDPYATTFKVCWDGARASGWVSFKRVGFPWTYHCPKCASEAEREHAEHYRNEVERERIKARNESR